MKWKQKATQIKQKWISGRFGDVVLVHASTALLLGNARQSLGVLGTVVLALPLWYDMHLKRGVFLVIFVWTVLAISMRFLHSAFLPDVCRFFCFAMILASPSAWIQFWLFAYAGHFQPNRREKKNQKSWGSHESHKTCNPLQTKHHQKKSQKILQQKQQNSLNKNIETLMRFSRNCLRPCKRWANGAVPDHRVLTTNISRRRQSCNGFVLFFGFEDLLCFKANQKKLATSCKYSNIKI